MNAEIQKEIQKQINELKDAKETIEKAAENSEDVKNGKCTKEDEKQEPMYYFSQAISDTCIQILESDATLNAISDLLTELKLEAKVAGPLFNLLFITMVNASFNSIVLYDKILTKALDDQFNMYNENFSKLFADVSAHTGAIDVLRSKISKLENQEKK